MRFEDIIKNESEKISKSLNNILNENDNYQIKIVDEVIDIYGENKKILTIKYELLGSYDTKSEIFNWAHNYYIVDKELLFLSKEVKKYSSKLRKYIINQKCEDNEYMERLYYYLSNSVFILQENKLLDIINMSIYITKCKGVIKNKNGNMIQLYFVKDIISY